MTSFDKDEKRISEALDALDLEITVPDLMPGIRKKLEDTTANGKRMGKPVRSVILIAAVVAVLGITAAAVSLGGFDWLLEKAAPPFGDVVEAVGQSAESQGIRITTVAAQHYSDMAVLYVTLEDTEGLGRVSEDTQLGFAMSLSVQNFYSDMIYFDSETGIAAYQFRLGSPDTFDGQSLSLQMNGLRYGGTDLGEIRMGIDLAKTVAQGEHNGQPYASSLQAPSEQLTPGHVADIPGTKSAWVSAIGVNHGYLAVQFAQPAGVDRFLGANSIRPYLLDADGNIIDWNGPGGVTFKTDAQLNPVHTAQRGAYDLMEIYFAVDTEKLDGYTLCFEGSTWNVVTGEWNLDVDLGSIQEVLEVTADITVGEVQMTNVVLTIHPLGMTLTGNGARDLDWYVPMGNAILETTEGDIELYSIGGSRPHPEGPYELIWHALSAIDMDSVIAVRIGDNRIEI
jgi:hypothetical protein